MPAGRPRSPQGGAAAPGPQDSRRFRRQEIDPGRRVIAIDAGTVEVLKAQAARQLEEQGKWDEAWVETGLVFTQENGAALDLALQAGIRPKDVSERLGRLG